MRHPLARLVVGFLLGPTLFASTISPRVLANPLIHNAEGTVRLRSPESAESSPEGPQIIEVDPETLECETVVTFDDIPGGDPPGTNYDNVLMFSGVSFAERFLGQTLTTIGTHDVLSGTPSNPLALQVGAPNHNLDVFRFTFHEPPVLTQVLDGLGPLGYPDYSAIGEGAFAVLFDINQPELGFSLLGGDRGTVTVNFFRRDGSLIDTIVLTFFLDVEYAFRRVGGIRDIAGISVHNNDGDGIAIDDVCYNIATTPIEDLTWGQIKAQYMR